MIEQHMTDFTKEQREALGLNDTMISAQAKMAATPWFRKLLTDDPRPTLRQVRCPVLAITGEKDLQVAANDNFTAIRESLTAGGNARVKTIEFPGLNHLFQTCTTGAVSESGQIEETFAPAALRGVSDWMRGHVGR